MSKLKYFAIRIPRILLTAFLSISILSCGGEGTLMTAGISGTGIVLGVITGFGSIFVNGVEYDIDQASIDVDSAPNSAQNNLTLGMVVRLEAKDFGDGTGLAESVVYDDAIEGPVEDVPLLSTVNANLKQFTILGHTVLIDATSTAFTIDNGTNFNFDTLAKGDIVEVSGFTDLNSNMIIATRVEMKVGHQNPAAIPVELHGVIEALDANTNTMTVQGVAVDLSSITDLDLTDLDDGLKVDLHVEVNGIYLGPLSIQASLIEGEDDDLQKLKNATGDVSLQGIVSQFTSGDNFFELNDIIVDVSTIDASTSKQLKKGFQVQVKGQFSGNELIAQELEIRSGESEFDAVIKSVDNIADKRIQIEYPGLAQSVELLFDNQSQLVDETSHHHSEAMKLNELKVGMEVKAQVKQVGSDWVVVSLKHDHLSKYKIRGYVTEKNTTDYNVTVNGLTIDLNATAKYEVDDKDYNRQAFFDFIDVNDPMKSFVDLEDENTNDDLADFGEVELDTRH